LFGGGLKLRPIIVSGCFVTDDEEPGSCRKDGPGEMIGAITKNK
jgi:hypothetical protein